MGEKNPQRMINEFGFWGFYYYAGVCPSTGSR